MAGSNLGLGGSDSLGSDDGAALGQGCIKTQVYLIIRSKTSQTLAIVYHDKGE